MSEKITFKEPAQGAIYMLAKGFKAFPIIPNDKRPQIEDWLTWGKTCSKGSISTYALGADSNWGVIPSLSGHLVVDVDCGYKMKGKKDAKKLVKATGDSTLANLEKKHGTMPKTFTVKTPSGGYHLYYKGTCRPTVGAVGEGIDTRSEESYVVAPGSTVPYYTAEGKRIKGTYTIVNDMEPVECPLWFLGLLEEKKKSSQAASRKGEEGASTLDTERNIADAISYLNDAPVCVLGDGTHNGEYLYQVFCKTRDFGVSKDQARLLVLQNYNDRCDPPWDMGDEADAEHFNKKLRNAYNYAQNNIGVESHEAKIKQAKRDFTHEPIDQDVKSAIKPLHLTSAADIIALDIPPREWVMANTLCRRYISILGAPGGTGKSTLEIIKALSIATGRNLLGDRYKVITKGPVIMYNLEDPLDELLRKVEAARLHYGLTHQEVKDLHLISGRDHGIIVCSATSSGVIVTHQKDIDTMIATINSVSAVYVSFDPLVRLHWAEENSNGQMDKVVRAVQQISSKTECAISLVHHSRKSSGSTKKGNEISTESQSGDQDIFRGAGSLLGGMRAAHVIETMTEEDARRLGVAQERRKFYFKLMEAKNTMSAPLESVDWFEKFGVQIANGEVIGVCKRSDLNAASEMKKAQEEEAIRDELLIFLGKHISMGEEREVHSLIGDAISEGIAIADTNRNRFMGRMQEALFGVQEYVVKQGKKRVWVVKREHDF